MFWEQNRPAGWRAYFSWGFLLWLGNLPRAGENAAAYQADTVKQVVFGLEPNGYRPLFGLGKPREIVSP